MGLKLKDGQTFFIEQNMHQITSLTAGSVFKSRLRKNLVEPPALAGEVNTASEGGGRRDALLLYAFQAPLRPNCVHT